MSNVDRQNKLVAAEDWTKVYQSFKNADFKSYDFDSLRRSMISYLRENYPEDFNDYIESSEYLALIDLIAYLGQNLAFRFDLNSRDNFLELADRRDSVLRLARFLSYNAKRNRSASGLLKFTSVSTTESIVDSNGRNLANQTIVWNDSANANWYEQFLKVINASLPESSQFGKPQDKATVLGVPTEVYRVNGTNTEVPLFSFSKNIDGKNMNFEVVSASVKPQDQIIEEAPLPGSSWAFLYRNDGSGAPSSNTGFFGLFKQGSLQQSTFAISRPGANESVDIDSNNINNDDVWLYDLDSLGIENNLWTPVSSIKGNNVIYNSLSKKIRKIYSVLTRTNDRVRLMFADGVFGDLPQGNFKVFYRTSNGLAYTVNPTDIRNVTITVPYISKTGFKEALTISLALKYAVTNASATESSEAIKANAPASYYTQNRMITGEDYNVMPLTVHQEIVKVKAVNRVSAGVSRYFEFSDVSGKYSSTNLFGNDGVLFKEPTTGITTFTSASRTDIENAVLNKIQPILSTSEVKNFYLDNYDPVDVSMFSNTIEVKTSATNVTTGIFRNQSNNSITKLGSYTASTFKYVVPGALVRFTPPVGYKFNGENQLVAIALAKASDKDYIWAKVVQVVGDGTASNTGVLATGAGPVVINEIVPTGAVVDKIIPKFTAALNDAVRTKVVDLIFARKQFGLRYDVDSTSWKVITESNINRKTAFSLGKAGNTSNQQLDSSWILLAEPSGDTYSVSSRGVRYVFESANEIRFFFDGTDKIYDTATGQIVKDTVTVLGINEHPDYDETYQTVRLPFNTDFSWQIVNDYVAESGYTDPTRVVVGFTDFDEDGVVDNPELFETIVNPSVNTVNKVIFQKAVDQGNSRVFRYFSNDAELIKVYATPNDVPTQVTSGQLVFIVSEGVVKVADTALPVSVWSVSPDYRGFIGRANIKFKYTHAANASARIDPAATNIMDVYLLTKTYDTLYRQWLAGSIATQPRPLSSDAMYISFGQELNKVKAISDEVIYHPAKYKNLFGSKAESSLQATFKVVKSPGVVISDNDIRAGVIAAITEFFSIENWDFGDTFYFSELATYVMSTMSPVIANIVIVPKQQGLAFGSLYEIKSDSDELFSSSATVDDVEVISEITASRIGAVGQVITSFTGSASGIASA